jgi:hypothetical protein
VRRFSNTAGPDQPARHHTLPVLGDVSEIGMRGRWPQAPGYADPPSLVGEAASPHRLAAVFWGGLNVVLIGVAGFVAYLALVTVFVPAASFEMAAWGAAVLRRVLLVGGGALAVAGALYAVNRALFGWAHRSEPAPEPRVLAGLFVAVMAVAVMGGAIESFLVHL